MIQDPRKNPDRNQKSNRFSLIPIPPGHPSRKFLTNPLIIFFRYPTERQTDKCTEMTITIPRRWCCSIILFPFSHKPRSHLILRTNKTAQRATQRTDLNTYHKLNVNDSWIHARLATTDTNILRGYVDMSDNGLDLGLHLDTVLMIVRCCCCCCCCYDYSDRCRRWSMHISCGRSWLRYKNSAQYTWNSVHDFQ